MSHEILLVKTMHEKENLRTFCFCTTLCLFLLTTFLLKLQLQHRDKLATTDQWLSFPLSVRLLERLRGFSCASQER